jgi:hypothetical protein
MFIVPHVAASIGSALVRLRIQKTKIAAIGACRITKEIILKINILHNGVL